MTVAGITKETHSKFSLSFEFRSEFFRPNLYFIICFHYAFGLLFFTLFIPYIYKQFFKSFLVVLL